MSHPKHDTNGGPALAIGLFLLALVIAIILVLVIGEPEEPEYGWSRHSEKGKRWDATHR